MLFKMFCRLEDQKLTGEVPSISNPNVSSMQRHIAAAVVVVNVLVDLFALCFFVTVPFNSLLSWSTSSLSLNNSGSSLLPANLPVVFTSVPT